MAIFVDENTKVVYQGLTGSQGKFYGLLNKAYGTQVVAGTNPKKAGTDVEGIPIFASVGEAVKETGATVSCIFIPAPGVRDAVMEAAEGGVEFIVCITEGVPAQDEPGSTTSSSATSPTCSCSGRTVPASSARQEQHRHHRGTHRARAATGQAVGRHREPVRHAHVPGALRAQAQEHRRHDVRRHRWRPRARGTTFIDCLERFEPTPTRRP